MQASDKFREPSIGEEVGIETVDYIDYDEEDVSDEDDVADEFSEEGSEIV